MEEMKLREGKEPVQSHTYNKWQDLLISKPFFPTVSSLGPLWARWVLYSCKNTAWVWLGVPSICGWCVWANTFSVTRTNCDGIIELDKQETKWNDPPWALAMRWKEQGLGWAFSEHTLYLVLNLNHVMVLDI